MCTTEVEVRTTSLRLFNKETEEIEHITINRKLTLAQAREIATLKNYVFIDKVDNREIFNVNTDKLLGLRR